MTQTALTREQVMSVAPGTDLNVMVAEHIFGWRRIQGPTHDYDGAVEHGEVLVPLDMSEAHAYAMMPPRGRIPLYIFVNREWSSDMSAAWEVEEKIKQLKLHVKYCGDLKRIVIGTGEYVGMFDYIHATPEQRCKAALLAVLDL